jgi:hypothetical protein
MGIPDFFVGSHFSEVEICDWFSCVVRGGNVFDNGFAECGRCGVIEPDFEGGWFDLA